MDMDMDMDMDLCPFCGDDCNGLCPGCYNHGCYNHRCYDHADKDYKQTDYELDTPLGQQYADGFDCDFL